MAGYLVFALAFGTFCSLSASNKNRDPLGWFVIGFVLQFIGAVMIIVIDKPRDDTRLSSVDELERLAALHQQGALTDAEFQTQKARVIDRA